MGIRVTRVEIKAIDPPKSVKDAMEKQMRAEREKRAAILTAEGVRQARILTAEGEKQSAILTAEGAKQSAILRAEGQAEAIAAVFQAGRSTNTDDEAAARRHRPLPHTHVRIRQGHDGDTPAGRAGRPDPR